MQEKIRLLLEKEKLTPKEFAMKISIQPSAVSHFRSGRNKPSIDVVQKILKAFPNINPDWLLLDSDIMYKHQKVEQRDLFSQDVSHAENIKISEPGKESVKQNIPDDSTYYQPVIKEIIKTAPLKEITRIVVYFSDNTYEDFLAR
ncbi:MAG: XRE family transcriptional regulator [Bacteroidia bacterium]|nr:XRE family transcriptional regulator [Bacteroidia bacterium]